MTTKTEFTELEQALYNFITMFSLHERDMVIKMVEWYPQASRDLEKQLARMRELARILR